MRKIEFDAAHRIKNHESKCKMVHGHRYVVEAGFERSDLDDLDSLGRVIDFGIIKEKLGSWINENFDHNIILSHEDKELGDFISSQTGQKVFYMNCSTTAENIARFLLIDVCPKLFQSFHIKCTSIRVYETPNCYAEAKLQ